MARVQAVFKTREGEIRTHHRCVSLCLLNLLGDPRVSYLILPNMSITGNLRGVIPKVDLGTVSRITHWYIDKLQEAKAQDDHVAEQAAIVEYNAKILLLLEKIKTEEQITEMKLEVVGDWEYRLTSLVGLVGFILDQDRLDVGRLG
jgi:hypothetical protein